MGGPFVAKQDSAYRRCPPAPQGTGRPTAISYTGTMTLNEPELLLPVYGTVSYRCVPRGAKVSPCENRKEKEKRRK